MFKFLFRAKPEEPAKVETQRESFARLVGDLNELIDGLSPKPAITLDPATGHISLALPEQLPDEALALPSPKTEVPEADDASGAEEEKEAKAA